MDMAKFWKMIRQVVFNIVVVNFLMNNAGYFIGVYRNGPEDFEDIREPPSIATFVWQYPAFVIIQECVYGGFESNLSWELKRSKETAE